MSDALVAIREITRQEQTTWALKVLEIYAFCCHLIIQLTGNPIP